MDKKKAYVGEIKNSGPQKINGPHVNPGKAGKGTVRKGTDLRAKK